MSQKDKLLTETQARQIVNKFLLETYFDSKISVTDCRMINKHGVQSYQLFGEITMHSRSLLDRFVYPPSANKFNFTIEIDALYGKIINYEII